MLLKELMNLTKDSGIISIISELRQGKQENYKFEESFYHNVRIENKGSTNLKMSMLTIYFSL